MTAVDDYIDRVIGGGDDMSSELEKIFSSTLKNSPYVDVITEGMNGVKVIRPPAGKLVVVHSLGGDPAKFIARNYGYSAVDKLVKAALNINAEPIGFANVIDASTSEKDAVLPYAEALVERANQYRLVVPNGEFAVLGNRVTVPVNISATMISLAPVDSELFLKVPGFIERDGVEYAVFDPKGKAVYMNSDGVGTKTEFYERSGRYLLALMDSLAMKLDDLIKLGATAQVVSDVMEVNDAEDSAIARDLYAIMGIRGVNNEDFTYICQKENVGSRLRGYKEGAFAFNLSGSSVSTIDEFRIKNPLHPSAGEYLMAIRGRPNPRSNGITDKRAIMVEMLGNEWHTTPKGQEFLEFLAEPSTVFYPAFRKLINSRLASSVYHMSGGAFNGKLARPLAKYGLFAKLENIFPADRREVELKEYRDTPNEVAYAKWSMRNEGFVTTSKPLLAREVLRDCGLECRIVSQLETAKNGRTGVELAGIKASNGENVYYSGMK